MLPDMTTRILTASLVALSACASHPQSGSPVRLAAADPSDTVVVNSHWPTALAVRALDAAGRVVARAPIRYAWAGGDSLPVSPTGAVTCTRSGNLTVRASLSRLHRTLVVQCRLVEYVRLPGPLQFILGDSILSRPFLLPLSAYGANGRPIAPYTASVGVKDSSVAALRGSTLAPRSRGITGIGAHIGDRDAWIGVHVYQRVGSLAALDTALRVPDRQRLFAAPVRLDNGDLIRQRLPPGQWMLTMLSETDTAPDRIHLRIEGAHCQANFFQSVRRWGCTAGPNATVLLYRPFGHGKPEEASGYLLVRWLFG